MAYLSTNVTTDWAASPELHFLAAILRQLVTDARSPSPQVRGEAVRFLANRRNLQYWEDLLGLRDGALQAHRSQLKGLPK